jgi:hypothetical protein
LRNSPVASALAVDVAAIVHQDLNDLLVPFSRSSLEIIAV